MGRNEDDRSQYACGTRLLGRDMWDRLDSRFARYALSSIRVWGSHSFCLNDYLWGRLYLALAT